MIIFTNVAPEYFIDLKDNGYLGTIKSLNIVNLTSSDIRYPLLQDLMPSAYHISEEAFKENDSEVFENEYFNYLDQYAFNGLMQILLNEFHNGGSCLTIIEVERSPYRDSIAFSLQKYFYIRYGIKVTMFTSISDWEDVTPKNSIFSPQGLMLMDRNIDILQQASYQKEV